MDKSLVFRTVFIFLLSMGICIEVPPHAQAGLCSCFGSKNDRRVEAANAKPLAVPRQNRSASKKRRQTINLPVAPNRRGAKLQRRQIHNSPSQQTDYFRRKAFRSTLKIIPKEQTKEFPWLDVDIEDAVRKVLVKKLKFLSSEEIKAIESTFTRLFPKHNHMDINKLYTILTGLISFPLDRIKKLLEFHDAMQCLFDGTDILTLQQKWGLSTLLITCSPKKHSVRLNKLRDRRNDLLERHDEIRSELPLNKLLLDNLKRYANATHDLYYNPLTDMKFSRSDSTDDESDSAS